MQVTVIQAETGADETARQEFIEAAAIKSERMEDLKEHVGRSAAQSAPDPIEFLAGPWLNGPLRSIGGQQSIASQCKTVESMPLPCVPAAKEAAAGTSNVILFRFSSVEIALLAYSIFYSAVSRLPFTLFATYMMEVLSLSYALVALSLGLYSLGRLIGAHLAGMYLGSLTMVFGTASGAVSWASILFFHERHWMIFIMSSFLLGFTETVTGLDTMLKIESVILCRTLERTQLTFRLQLIFTCIGVLIGWTGGSVLYQLYGIGPVGVACIIFSCINLGILAAVFATRRIYRQPFINLGDILSEYKTMSLGARQSTISIAGAPAGEVAGERIRATAYNIDRVEILDPSGSVTTRSVRVASVRASHISKYEAGRSIPRVMQTPLFLGAVVACFFFTTLGISTQNAISVLYWKQIWGVSPLVAGIIMSAGEFLGVCFLIFFGEPFVFNSAITKLFGPPANLASSCFLLGLGCWLITAKSQLVGAFGTVLVHICNSLLHSFQAELISMCSPGDHFGKWISLSYVAKRAANCVCTAGSVLVFEAFGPQAAYRIVGSGLILYAAILGICFAWMRILPCQLRK